MSRLDTGSLLSTMFSIFATNIVPFFLITAVALIPWIFVSVTALILIRMTFRDPQGGDALFWLVRWPFWLLVVGVLPLILIRVLILS